ncbi:hypothetical protein HMPREF0083_00378 [Aneurinibacillus aneurinilyticus ATCC 12856]|uniref:Uncharacterized protein n=1 Tax=Aneurinibacillus aneurinilyticus ATCC 12856 TaxID=649747 RepID=U1X947_ANEAE|nr:hypothetical protein HMPREF0083_00378 [Aneurinibacillus aneurinilyticus ATCC 12856]
MVKGWRVGERSGWMRPTLRQKKGQCVFSYLLPQKFVDVSNQMYILYLSIKNNQGELVVFYLPQS